MSVLSCLLVITSLVLSLRLYTCSVKPDEYVVNLDLPPEARWINLLKERKNVTGELKSAIKLFWNAVPTKFHLPLKYILKEVERFLPDTYAREIKGIAAHLGFEIEDVVLPNVIYDALAFCTSIVAQDMDGYIWHGRNLDYDFPEALRNITVVVHFHRNGKLLFSSTSFVGMVGVATGQKPGVFTISLDERDSGTFWENILTALLDRKSKLVPFLIRDILETKETYGDVVAAINDTDTISPAYYIVAGTKPEQGAVITKARLHALDVWKISITHNRWYLVETNYDHWRPPPASDDRRYYAIRYMNAVGQANITAAAIYKVLSTPPLLRRETAYTTVMSARLPGLFETEIQYYLP